MSCYTGWAVPGRSAIGGRYGRVSPSKGASSQLQNVPSRRLRQQLSTSAERLVDARAICRCYAPERSPLAAPTVHERQGGPTKTGAGSTPTEAVGSRRRSTPLHAPVTARESTPCWSVTPHWARELAGAAMPTRRTDSPTRPWMATNSKTCVNHPSNWTICRMGINRTEVGDAVGR